MLKSSAQIMGVLNVTPDSFFDGGKYSSEKSIISQVNKMIEEGVDIIDVGGMSSKPGSEIIPLHQEIQRICKPIQLIRSISKNILISIDTLRSEVAEKAISTGANIVNDISGGEFDNNMFPFIAEAQVPYCLMHMRGTPKNMQSKTEYINIIDEIKHYFFSKLEKLYKMGINDITLDPGFGFAKNLNQNYQLLASLDEIKIEGHKLLVGVSRKSMIYKLLELSPQEALNGTTVLHTFALTKGADILRVHDIKEAKEAIILYQKLNSTF